MQQSVAILSPGPSLARFIAHPPAAGTHPARVGVNRAATVAVCDYWAFCDVEAFTRWAPTVEGNPVCCTIPQCVDRAKPDPRKSMFRWMTFDEMDTSCPADPDWRMFSFTGAIVVAEYACRLLGLDRITVYGCDLRGVADWDGHVPPQTGSRSKYRWDNETHKIGHQVAWLRRIGITIEGIPEGVA